MSVTPRFHLSAAIAVSSVLCLSPLQAGAQSRLPWSDANPLEKTFGEAEGKGREAQSGKPAGGNEPGIPAIAAVPVPDRRPEDAASQTPASRPGSESGEAPSSEVPQPTGAPVRRDGAAPPLAGADIALPVEPPPAVKPDAPAQVPADPADTAGKSLGDIPVPEIRPADAPGSGVLDDDPAATPTTAPLPVTTVPEPAPNSTEALKGRVPEISPATAVIAAAAIEDAQLCEAELRKRGAAFTVEESISEGECGVLRPVNVTQLSSGVKVSPETRFLCHTALALDTWMTDSVIPAAKAEFPADDLTEFRHASTYVCRPRASESGISEHARGSAIDIAAFVFGTRAEIGVETHAAGTPEAKFQAKLQKGACGPFKTVLGPGTDADHASHFHLDIAARQNDSTYCR